MANKKNRIPKYNDLLPIASFIAEKCADTCPVSVTFTVPDVETVTRVNEDFFYRLNPNGDESQINKEAKEVVVNIYGVEFRYIAETENK